MNLTILAHIAAFLTLVLISLLVFDPFRRSSSVQQFAMFLIFVACIGYLTTNYDDPDFAELFLVASGLMAAERLFRIARFAWRNASLPHRIDPESDSDLFAPDAAHANARLRKVRASRE